MSHRQKPPRWLVRAGLLPLVLFSSVCSPKAAAGNAAAILVSAGSFTEAVNRARQAGFNDPAVKRARARRAEMRQSLSIQDREAMKERFETLDAQVQTLPELHKGLARAFIMRSLESLPPSE